MKEIQHNPSEKKFFVEVEGKEARLSYREMDDGVLDFCSTFVPPEGRGQGLARKLTEAGIDYARKNNLKIKPSCSYVEKYFEKHSELQALKA